MNEPEDPRIEREMDRRDYGDGDDQFDRAEARYERQVYGE